MLRLELIFILAANVSLFSLRKPKLRLDVFSLMVINVPYVYIASSGVVWILKNSGKGKGVLIHAKSH